MSWQNLLKSRQVERHVTSKNELKELRALIKRNLDDAKIDALEIIWGDEGKPFSVYFSDCRRKRNLLTILPVGLLVKKRLKSFLRKLMTFSSKWKNGY